MKELSGLSHELLALSRVSVLTVTSRLPFMYLGYEDHGPVTIGPRKAPFEIKDASSQLEIRRGDKILCVHLLTSRTEDEKTSLQNVSEAFSDIASTMKAASSYPKDPFNPANFKAVIGITYEQLARITRRMGFKIAEAKEVSWWEREKVEIAYRVNIGKATGKPMGKVMVCYQSTEEFLQRHFKQSS